MVFNFTSSNNASALQLTLVYTATNLSTQEVSPDQTLTGTVLFPHCDECPTQND